MTGDFWDYFFIIGMTAVWLGLLVSMVVYYIRFRRSLSSGKRMEKKGWITTTGMFTGRSNEVPGRRTKSGTAVVPYKEYEVQYYVDGEVRKGWINFYPGPDSDMITEKLGVTVRYSRRRPWNFEIMEVHYPQSFSYSEELETYDPENFTYSEEENQ